MTAQHIPIEHITPNPEQPRRYFNPDALQRLADSIAQHGVLQPILVEPNGDGRYILIAGERRLLASQLARKTTIPVNIRPPLNGSGQQTRLVEAIVENTVRDDMTPIEEARAYARLRDEFGYNRGQIGRLISRSTTYVTSRLKLLELDPEIQELIHTSELSADPTVARSLLSITDPESRIQLAQRAAKRSLTGRSIIAACAHLNKKIAQLKIEEERLENRRTRIEALHQRRPIPVDLAPALQHALANGHNAVSPERQVTWPAIKQAINAACHTCHERPPGELPGWRLVMTAAADTCQACAMHEYPDVCRECPVVTMLTKLTEATHVQPN